MKRVLTLAPVVSALLIGLGGCAHDSQTLTSSRETPANADPALAPAQMANSTTAPPLPNTYVPDGVEFTVILNEDVGTADSISGQKFTGQLAEDLRAADGSVFAPAGATVRGKVDRVVYGTRPSIQLDFETVETAAGPAVLETTIRDAGRSAVVAPANASMMRGGGPDTVLYPPGVGTMNRVGGGPPSSPEVRPSVLPAVELMRGTPVRLRLRHPLLAADFSVQYGE